MTTRREISKRFGARVWALDFGILLAVGGVLQVFDALKS
jgi:hypothetical protein